MRHASTTLLGLPHRMSDRFRTPEAVQIRTQDLRPTTRSLFYNTRVATLDVKIPLLPVDIPLSSGYHKETRPGVCVAFLRCTPLHLEQLESTSALLVPHG
jgi:hypothetical protein